MRMYRQGDVLIVESRHTLGTKAPDKILVYGETTGHAHRVEGDALVMDLRDGSKVIQAAEPFKVVHEEHDTIEIPEGFYRVVRQREYDEKEIRYVAD